MRKGILLWALLGFVSGVLLGQKTPHPSHIMKYYFTAAEGAKQSVVVPLSLLRFKGVHASEYMACFPNEGFRFGQFQTQIQTGFDTILAIEEMISCGPFLAHRTETTNGEYKTFLKDSQWIKSNLGFAIQQLQVDSSVWAPLPATAESAAVINPFSYLYYQSTTYDNFPVVGISQLQAVAYCEWLTHRLNESVEYASLQTELKKNGILLKVELPTVAEWMYLYEMVIQEPGRKGVAQNKIRGNHFRNNPRKGGGLITYLQHQEYGNLPLSFGGTQTARGMKIQNELSQNMLKPLAANYSPAKPYPAVSHLLGNVAEWTSTAAYGHLYNNKTTILNTNGQLIENAYQLMKVFDFKDQLVNASDLEQHFAVKGGSWAQDFYYLDPMSVFFMQSNHSNNHVGFRTIIHFYPNPK